MTIRAAALRKPRARAIHHVEGAYTSRGQVHCHRATQSSGAGHEHFCHAVRREHTAHVEHGDPLHVDMTALLLARGADPHHLRNGTSIETEAELLRHWLAAEVIRAWKPANPELILGRLQTRQLMGRNQ